MEDYDKAFPNYGFKRHKGYGTSSHLKNILLHGPSPIHRRTFSGVIPSSAEKKIAVGFKQGSFFPV